MRPYFRGTLRHDRRSLLRVYVNRGRCLLTYKRQSDHGPRLPLALLTWAVGAWGGLLRLPPSFGMGILNDDLGLSRCIIGLLFSLRFQNHGVRFHLP